MAEHTIDQFLDTFTSEAPGHKVPVNIALEKFQTLLFPHEAATITLSQFVGELQRRGETVAMLGGKMYLANRVLNRGRYIETVGALRLLD